MVLNRGKKNQQVGPCFLRKKGAIEWEFNIWLIIAIVGAVVILIFIFLLKDKWIGAISYIKNFFRFGG